jgi:hypothetical protein
MIAREVERREEAASDKMEAASEGEEEVEHD